ncbi:carbohydrate ABC transporter permease [Breznakiella homolactica]|uniref:Sugar ABC transporter permease n=1 Tax=Breznakiella homolactica TaxID=2798577 RepID=A0A7T8BB17_9SPIR|nr:sugar ABC transporter permease [Breznakiella homolactica]QQO10082.1 sugar ABC transporter permease [Breznakiella homolactica]
MVRSLNSEEKRIGTFFTLPVFILIFLVMGFPFIYTVYLSFTDKTAGYDPRFIGFANYISNFKDPQYWLVIRNTVIYTVSCIIFKLVLGMAFALLLNEKFRGRSIVRVSMLLPWAIPGMVAANTWKWMYNDQYGIINAVMRNIGIISKPIPWLGDMKLALLSVIIVNIWRGIPFFLFSILGALQTIDDQLYDAGKIDGANMVQRFTKITLPSVLPVVAISTLLSTIWTFNDFDNIWLITGGGPLNASSVIATYTYEVAFLYNEMGRALSIAVSVIPVLVLLMLLVTRRMNTRDA